MSFRDRFSNVAALLAGTSLASDAPEDDKDTGGSSEGGSDNDEGGSGEEQEQGGSGGGGSDAGSKGPSRSAVEAAFEKDAAKLVKAERDRCIKVFTSDAGKRSPIAAGKLLDRAPNLTADDTIDTLNDVGSDASSGGDRRQAHRDRINDARDTRVNTGEGRESGEARADVLDQHKKERAKRNEAREKKGEVRSGREEIDA